MWLHGQAGRDGAAAYDLEKMAKLDRSRLKPTFSLEILRHVREMMLCRLVRY
jgi:hypothetical protein